MDTKLLNSVQHFYSKTIQKEDDFKVIQCRKKCEVVRKDIREAMALLHDDIKLKNFGCGIITPLHLCGLSVLDLGSGAGMDCFILSKLVGPSGVVTGIDMTQEQLNVANKFKDYHANAFGHQKSNVTFVKGYIEDLKSAGIKDESQDIVVSNCVLCLVKDKRTVLREAYRVLKQGGELVFSDIYANKPVPSSLFGDEQLWGEGLAGAFFWKDLHQVAEEIGFSTPLIVSTAPLDINDSHLKNAVDAHGLQYISVTYRLFKSNGKEQNGDHTVPECDHMTATYNGEITHAENIFHLSKHLSFKTNVETACSDAVYRILSQSRFADFFSVQTTFPDGKSFPEGVSIIGSLLFVATIICLESDTMNLAYSEVDESRHYELGSFNQTPTNPLQVTKYETVLWFVNTYKKKKLLEDEGYVYFIQKIL